MTRTLRKPASSAPRRRVRSWPRGRSRRVARSRGAGRAPASANRVPFVQEGADDSRVRAPANPLGGPGRDSPVRRPPAGVGRGRGHPASMDPIRPLEVQAFAAWLLAFWRAPNGGG
jgi:hypothetical protein